MDAAVRVVLEICRYADPSISVTRSHYGHARRTLGVARKCEDMRMTVALFEVTFLSEDEGGRKSLPDLLEGGYMPHLLVQGSPQLGVRFLPADDGEFVAGIPAVVAMEFLYEPNIAYAPLKTANPIAIVEGGVKIVGWAQAK